MTLTTWKKRTSLRTCTTNQKLKNQNVQKVKSAEDRSEKGIGIFPVPF